MHLRFIQTVVCINSLFLSIVEWYFIAQKYHSYPFTHWKTLECFYFWTDHYISMYVQVIFMNIVFIPPTHMGVAKSWNICLTLLKTTQIFYIFSSPSYDEPRQHIKKQRHYFVNKGPSSQGYGFSSTHVWMLELDYKGSWALKKWCFWTVMLEKTLESPLDSKEIQPVHPKGDQSWVLNRRTDVKAEIPILWSTFEKNYSLEKTLMLGKIKGRRRKGQ